MSHRLFHYKFLACPFLLAHVIHFHPAIIHKYAYRWYVTNFGSLKDINTIRETKPAYCHLEKINFQTLFSRVGVKEE